MIFTKEGALKPLCLLTAVAAPQEKSSELQNNDTKKEECSQFSHKLHHHMHQLILQMSDCLSSYPDLLTGCI